MIVILLLLFVGIGSSDRSITLRIPTFHECITKPWPQPSKPTEGVVKQASIICVNAIDGNDYFYLCDELKNRRNNECVTKNFTRKVWGQLHRDSVYCDVVNPSAEPSKIHHKIAAINKRQLTTTVTNHFHYFTMKWPLKNDKQLEYNICLHVMWNYMCNEQSESSQKKYDAHLKFDDTALSQEPYLSHGVKMPRSEIKRSHEERPLILLPGTISVMQSLTNQKYTFHLNETQSLSDLSAHIPTCVKIESTPKRFEQRDSNSMTHEMKQARTSSSVTITSLTSFLPRLIILIWILVL